MAAAEQVEPVAATLADLPIGSAMEEAILKSRLRQLRGPADAMMATIIIFAAVVAWLSLEMVTHFPLYWLAGLAAVAAAGGFWWSHQEQLDRLMDKV